jgi:hypothetical protein
MQMTLTPHLPISVSRTKRNLVAGEPSNLPPVPDTIATLLNPQDARFRFTETSYYVVERWRPVPMNQPQAYAAREYLHLVETVMEPMDKGLLLTRILALLSHYRPDPNPPEVEYAIAQDWAEDLGEFPGWVVEEAARQWRRTKKFKPQICEMREACERIAARERTLLDRLRRLVDADEAYRDPARRRASKVISQVAAGFSAGE